MQRRAHVPHIVPILHLARVHELVLLEDFENLLP